MRKTLYSAVLTVALVAPAVFAGPAAAQGNGNKEQASAVTLLSDPAIAWSAGASEWINLMWTTEADLEQFEVTVVSMSPGVEVEYPGGGARSGLYNDADLLRGEVDFTAIKLTTTRPGKKKAEIEVSWVEDGVAATSSVDIELSNQKYLGDDFAILTQTAEATTDVDDPQRNWIDLDYKGLAPTNRAMSLTISSELQVYYPQDTFTSLYHDQILQAGEIDVARVWFDPSLLTPGEYVLTVAIEYVDSVGSNQSTTHDVILTVTAPEAPDGAAVS